MTSGFLAAVFQLSQRNLCYQSVLTGLMVHFFMKESTNGSDHKSLHHRKQDNPCNLLILFF